MPMPDGVARIRMKGSLFIDAVENGLSMYPKYEGRWPIVGGMRMKINTDNEPGQRIDKSSLVMANGDPFDNDKEYVVAMKCYLLAGKDGYRMLTDPSIIKLPPVFGEEDPNI